MRCAICSHFCLRSASMLGQSRSKGASAERCAGVSCDHFGAPSAECEALAVDAAEPREVWAATLTTVLLTNAATRAEMNAGNRPRYEERVAPGMPIRVSPAVPSETPRSPDRCTLPTGHRRQAARRRSPLPP